MNQTHYPEHLLFSKYAQDSVLRSFFGRIENSINCFRDILTLSFASSFIWHLRVVIGTRCFKFPTQALNCMYLCLQVRTLFLQWLPWILRMQRPGKPITRKTIMMTNRMRELELKEKTSKSLLANVLDMDDDFRLVSPFSLKKANISERHFLFGWKQKAGAQKLIYIHTTWTVRFAVNLFYSTLLSFNFIYIL